MDGLIAILDLIKEGDNAEAIRQTAICIEAQNAQLASLQRTNDWLLSGAIVLALSVSILSGLIYYLWKRVKALESAAQG